MFAAAWKTLSLNNVPGHQQVYCHSWVTNTFLGPVFRLKEVTQALPGLLVMSGIGMRDQRREPPTNCTGRGRHLAQRCSR